MAIALTFDDGPGPETHLILDILREHQVQATFFLCGANAEQSPEVVRRIVAEGHCVGNHAYSHKSFLGKTSGWMRDEIEQTNRILALQIGTATSDAADGQLTLFRPPYGLRWFGLSPVLRSLDLTAVMWDVNSEDWKRPTDQISERVVSLTKAGSIILMHDGLPPQEAGLRTNTVRALPKIIQQLSATYQFVTVPQLAKLQGRFQQRDHAAGPTG